MQPAFIFNTGLNVGTYDSQLIGPRRKAEYYRRGGHIRYHCELLPVRLHLSLLTVQSSTNDITSAKEDDVIIMHVATHLRYVTSMHVVTVRYFPFLQSSITTATGDNSTTPQWAAVIDHLWEGNDK